MATTEAASPTAAPAQEQRLKCCSRTEVCPMFRVHLHHQRTLHGPISSISSNEVPFLPDLCCNRIEFSPDSSCIWALAVMDSPDSDTGACSDTAGSGGSSSSLLCFSVADGSLLQQLQRPHGASAVSSFCLDQQGCVLVSCGADHLVKLWPVGGSNASQQRQQQLDVLPPCQGFTAHHGTVTGASRSWSVFCVVDGLVLVSFPTGYCARITHLVTTACS